MRRRDFQGFRALCAVAVAAAFACAATVPAAGALPDGRGWELASPSDKNGGDVMPVSNRTRVAVDGNAVNFTSLIGFGNVRGATIGTEYVAERTGTPGTGGWVTHGVSPAQQPLPTIGAVFGLDPAYDGDMSADLSTGVFRANRPITDAPNVAGLINLYVRRDLRTAGAGSYQLITDPGFAIAPPFVPVRPYLAGASSDFSHIIFESAIPLSRDVPACVPVFECQPQLYEWANGTLRLAGVLPDGTTAPTSQAGLGAAATRPTPHMISADGSRIFFQAPIGSGNVYMRVDGTTTVQLNASEKTTPEAPQGAVLWDASVDGTRIFFGTSEGLVDGDDDGGQDYYMYDVNAPARERLTLVSRDGEPSVVDSGSGILGASNDGRQLYFMMAGQLVAGEDPLVTAGLYAWHDGVVRYIGSFANPADVTLNRLSESWLFINNTTMARVAADGSHVMFAATDDSGFRGRGGFGGYDRGTACGPDCREIYVYSADSGQLRCASCNPSGAPATGMAQVNTKLNAYASNVTSNSHLNHALSSDGRWAFFNSPDPLVPEDVNGRVDAYQYNTLTDRVSLLSSGRSSDDSYFLEASASGRDAFFVTRERLVGWDVDGNYDLYDARVGGGLPEPVPPPSACAGDACQGGGAAAVAPGASASRGFQGKGDAGGKLPARKAKHKRCKRGTRRIVKRGKVRCVRRKAHRGRRATRSRVEGDVAR